MLTSSANQSDQMLIDKYAFTISYIIYIDAAFATDKKSALTAQRWINCRRGFPISFFWAD
jgi:hypothetical protein